jgi:hypothetical protein
MRSASRIVAVVMASLALAACSAGGAQSGAPSASASAAPSPASSPAASPVVAGPSSSASADAAVFTSAQYGYSVQVPPGWTAEPATSAWDGGDVDHSADYADRFADTDANTYFVLGTPTDRSSAEFAADHLDWLAANRGCPAPASETEVSVDGATGVRVAIHCPDGVYGATLVSKVMVVSGGEGLIVTSFSPDTGPDAFAPLDALVSSMRWTQEP